MFIRMHDILPGSRVNGPGRRSVLFFQGCRRACPGCFNPGLQSFNGGSLMSIEDVMDCVQQTKDIVGLTFSGGEPFEQASALAELCARLRRTTRLSLMAYSGFTLAEIQANACRAKVLPHLDILVDGPYLRHLRSSRDYAGSTNQRIHLLTDHYRPQDLISGQGRMEVRILINGQVCVTGFPRYD
jgi:anaerobic ribonucleoside-triphosphate reductase activating protein